MDCFRITPGNHTLTVNGCTVTTTGCSFNPTVFEVLPVGGITELRVSGSGGHAGIRAAALAFGAAVLVTGFWFVRRRTAQL
jgi:hypothetical protein